MKISRSKYEEQFMKKLRLQYHIKRIDRATDDQEVKAICHEAADEIGFELKGETK